MSNSFWDLPIATIEKALSIRKQIESLKEAKEAIMGSISSAGNGKVAKRRGRPSKTAVVVSANVNVDGRKGKRSAATIARMKAAQQARWAKKNGASSKAVKPVKAAKIKRFVSPEARAKMAAAQKARWAKKNGGAPTPAESAAKAPKKRKTMSPEAREKIAAAQRARWAKQKAA